MLIDILDINKIDDKNLLRIYYYCCVVGGYESDDKLVHLLVEKISKSIFVNLSLYYPFEVDIIKRINDTQLRYEKEENDKINKFINMIKNNNMKSEWLFKVDAKFKHFINSTASFRGFSEKVNHSKIFYGNYENYGKVLDYFINDKDVNMLKKLMQVYKNDIYNVLTIYYQVPQLMYPLKVFWENHQTLLADNNICVSFKKHNCVSRNVKKISNLSTSIIHYGDCRELNMILGLLLTIKELHKFKKYWKLDQLDMMGQLLMNQIRIVNVDMYMNCKKIKSNIDGYKYYDLDYVATSDYSLVENHNFITKMKYNNQSYNMISRDIMYNDYMLRFDTDNKYDKLFLGYYLLDKQVISYDKEQIYFGTSIFNEDIHQYGKLKISLMRNYYFNDKNLSNEYLFLNKHLVIPSNFYDINKYVVERENLAYLRRKKYFKHTKKLIEYSKDDNNHFGVRYLLYTKN